EGGGGGRRRRGRRRGPSARESRPSARSARRASAGADEVQHLAVVRPASLVLLREDERAVGDDVELGLLAFANRGVDPVVVQLGRETRSPSVVPASDGAVEDLDRHVESVPGAKRATWRRYAARESAPRRRRC